MQSFKAFLNESSLGRVHQHTQNRNIGVITAHRGEHSELENHERNKNLEHDIRKHGHGFIHVRGSYVENKGTPQERKVKEHSYIVVGKKGHDDGAMKGFLRHHGKKYGQEATVYKPHDHPSAHMLDTKTGHSSEIGEFHPRKIGDYHSTILHTKRSFTFAHHKEEADVQYEFLVPVMPLIFGKGREEEFV